MTDSAHPLRIKAPAKINLFLHIIGKRADGYHELVTLMQKLDLSDELRLTIRDTPGISCSCDNPAVPTDDGNSAVQAAYAFYNAFAGRGRFGVHIRISKKIPVAAGLGGGSSDAGAVLRGLNILHGRPFTTQTLIELARPLGADVAFFADDHSTVLAMGIGDILEPCPPVEEYLFVLINPGFPVATSWVYENYPLTFQTRNFNLPSFRKLPAGSFDPAWLDNDLERVTLKHYPQIQRIKDVLDGHGAAGSLMSGSGPTVFGLFRERRHAEHAVRVMERIGKIDGKYPLFAVIACAGA
jgi:4-diphosphocytidyl-2-C-methyl-D-erythritol kinase